MGFLRKFGAFVLLVLAAPLAAAIFGAAHDQLSYTLAPEYYTRFKFVQFAWAGVGSMSPRAGAAVVGVLATWWVGFYAGVVLAAVGLRYPSAGMMLRRTTHAFAVVAAVALAAGLLGFAAGWLGFDPAREYVAWSRPAGLIAPRRFFAVGMMHNGSYLGGAIGALVAAARLWRGAWVAPPPPAATATSPAI